jgi:SAM-dependent methyltransferase
MWIGAETRCPGCGQADTVLVRRKWLVTALYECPVCRLRFRVPKEDARAAEAFYRDGYEAGFTTALPSEEELRELLERGFASHEKDYQRYLDVLRAAGISPPARVLDFGSSWGYGAWQLRRAGFEVVGYEGGERRARFAAERLGIRMVTDVAAVTHSIDCFFSAHVLEHLADPNIFWKAASTALKPAAGAVVAFVPNGNPALQSEHGSYHLLWGQVHPLLITPDYLRRAAHEHGFRASVYSSPYDLSLVASRGDDPACRGPELAVVARRPT